MNESCAFILSSWRSGSTLLQSLLNAHSRMVGSHELHLPFIELNENERAWWRWRSRPVRRRVLHLAREALAAHGLRIPDRELLDPDPRRNRVTFERISKEIRARAGKEILVEKTPGYSLNAAAIDRLFPEGVRKILLVRSPGGVAASCAATFPGTFPTIESGLEHWLRSYSALDNHYRTAAPETFLRVRYEDLIAGAEEPQRICAFLGVAFEPAMLRYGERGGRSALTGKENWGDPSEMIRSGRVDPTNAERWRAVAGEAVDRWLRDHPEAARLAESFGYGEAVAAQADR